MMSAAWICDGCGAVLEKEPTCWTSVGEKQPSIIFHVSPGKGKRRQLDLCLACTVKAFRDAFVFVAGERVPVLITEGLQP